MERPPIPGIRPGMAPCRGRLKVARFRGGWLVGDLLSFASESVALAFEDDDLGMVDEAVNHGCDGYGVAEDLCPGGAVLAGREDERLSFIAG